MKVLKTRWYLWGLHFKILHNFVVISHVLNMKVPSQVMKIKRKIFWQKINNQLLFLCFIWYWKCWWCQIGLTILYKKKNQDIVIVIKFLNATRKDRKIWGKLDENLCWMMFPHFVIHMLFWFPSWTNLIFLKSQSVSLRVFVIHTTCILKPFLLSLMWTSRS